LDECRPGVQRIPFNPSMRITMAFWSWSKAPAGNATADPTINWAEGQSPSSVNDSARAMMARAAEWRDDVSGIIPTINGPNAYTLNSNQGFDSLTHMNGAMIAFVPNVTNGATVTLAVDGLTAKPLRYGPNLELQSGMLIQGTPYVAVYNNSDGAFYLRGFNANPYGIPLGGMLPYVGSSAPNTAFALPFGQAISRTTYATLFSLIGVTFGNGDTTTTFNLPDLRGRAIFGLDNMGGSTAGRIGSVPTDNGTVTGTALGSTGGSATHALTSNEMPSHTHTASVSPNPHSHTVHTFSGGLQSLSPGGFSAPDTAQTDLTSSSTSLTVTNANTGGGAAHAILPPCMVLPFILRVI
jgi:microcystin-dependent protein